MDYYDADRYSNQIARNAGMAATALLVLVALSVEGGIPTGYIWLGCGLFGLVIYHVVKTWMIVRTVPRIETAPEPLRSEVEPEPDSAPLPDRYEWIGEINWAGLRDYVRNGEAQFSRTALATWIDQRIYSPRDPDIGSFPELMCRIGAAVPVRNGSGLTTYTWSPRAVNVLEALHRMGTGEHTPAPLVA